MKLAVEQLDFSYEVEKVLTEIDFDLEGGDILALIGPNGSGKSTLLRCINRILKPDRGVIYLDQKEIDSLNRKEIARAVGYVPQQEETAFPLTVFEAVLMGRKPHISWKARGEDLEMVSGIITELGLEDLALRNLNQLSGGQRQKVSIARALAQKPRVLLLDEPTSNLDLKHQLEILRLIKEQARSGVAVVITVHDLTLAGRFSDRIIMLNEGRIFAAGGREILTRENIEEVYGVKVTIQKHGEQLIIIPEEPR